jgi:fructose-1-phosphate kinase PfkB-like protein
LPNGFPSEIIETICRISSSRNGQAVVDVAGVLLLSALKASPFLVKANQSEISKTFGIDVAGTHDLKRLLETTISMGAQNAVLTFGRDGWIACVDGKYLQCRIDANSDGFDIGAGDAMMAGLLFGLEAGDSWTDILQFATRVAAASTYCRSAGEIIVEKIYNSPPCLIQPF